MYISLKYLYIVIDFLSSRWLTALKLIFQLNKIKNGITFTNNMSAVINIYLWILTGSLGILTISPAMCIVFFLVVFPFKAEMFLPQIVCAISISWTVTGKSMIFWLWKIHLKSLTGGYPILAYRVFYFSAPLICLLENPCLFSEKLFISTTALPVGL